MEEKKKRKKIIVIIIIAIIILAIFLVIPKFFSNQEKGVFYEELFSYLKENNYSDLEVEEMFLKNKDLYDEDFTCKDIKFKDNKLELYDCDITKDNDITFESFCTYDGEEFACKEEIIEDDELELDNYSEDIVTDDNKNTSVDNPTSHDEKVVVDNSVSKLEKEETTSKPDIEEKPEVPTSNINFKFSETGFTNNDIEVEIESDNEIKYCVSSTNNCTPASDYNDNIELTKEGIYYICVIDTKTKEKTCSKPVTIDKTVPTINEPTIKGTKGDNDWYKTHVEIIPTGGTDNLSGIKDVNVDIAKIDYDTTGQIITITAIDKAGNIATKQYTFKVDATAPTIDELTYYGAPGNNDWFLSDITVETPTGSDSLSGLKSISINKTLFTEETNGEDLIVTAVDNAGNIKTYTKVIKIDKTKPSITDYKISGTQGENDWYTSKVVIDKLIGFDSGSGIDTNLISKISKEIDYETKGENVKLEIEDIAGNKGFIEIPIKIDLTDPTSGEIILKGDAVNGWYTKDVEVDTVVGVDNISGISSSKLNMHLVLGKKLETTVTLTTIDNAGRTTVISKIVKIDKEIPEVGTLQFNGDKTTPDNEWFTSNVAIDFEDGTDAGSGHDKTVVNLLNINTNTVGTIITITTKDLAGLENTYSETVKIDKDKPSLSIKSDNQTIFKGIDYSVRDLFDEPVYSISGGTMSCTIENTKDLAVGNYSSTCTLTGGNGLVDSKTVNFVIEYDENAIKEELVGIKSTTNSYIKTTFKPSNNTRIVSDFTFLGPRGTAVWLFSSRLAYKNQMIGIAWSTLESLLQFGNESYNLGKTAYKVNTRHKIDLSKSGLFLDDVYYTTPETKVWKGSNDLYIFANNQAGTAIGHNNGQAIMHSSQVYEDDILMLDLIPVETMSGEVGLYDKVSESLLENVGTFTPIYK